jgi:hypothetical protein
MHYLNASQSPLHAHVDLDIGYSSSGADYQRAGLFASYQKDIAVPPHSGQTVDGHCKVPSGVHFFSMTTHSHKQTVTANVRRWANDAPGDMLVETKNWERPTIVTWPSPFLDLSDDEQLYYSCTYRNDTDATIVQGESAAKNEMCMAVGYYFPASVATICIDSLSLTK